MVYNQYLLIDLRERILFLDDENIFFYILLENVHFYKMNIRI